MAAPSISILAQTFPQLGRHCDAGSPGDAPTWCRHPNTGTRRPSTAGRDARRVRKLMSVCQTPYGPCRSHGSGPPCAPPPAADRVALGQLAERSAEVLCDDAPSSRCTRRQHRHRRAQPERTAAATRAGILPRRSATSRIGFVAVLRASLSSWLQCAYFVSTWLMRHARSVPKAAQARYGQRARGGKVLKRRKASPLLSRPGAVSPGRSRCVSERRSCARSVSSSRSATRGCMTAPPMAAVSIAAGHPRVRSGVVAHEHSGESIHHLPEWFVVCEIPDDHGSPRRLLSTRRRVTARSTICVTRIRRASAGFGSASARVDRGLDVRQLGLGGGEDDLLLRPVLVVDGRLRHADRIGDHLE